MIASAKSRVLYRFERDLRLDDNPSLARAADEAGRLFCVYCHDTALDREDRFGLPRLGSHRRLFIEQAVFDLAASLQARGQALIVLRGDPVVELGQFIEEQAIERVVRSRGPGHDEGLQWQRLARQHPDVEFAEYDSNTLLDVERSPGPGDLPATFSKFRRLVERLPVSEPIGAPALAPIPGGRVSARDLPPSPDAPEARFEGGETAAWSHLGAYFSTRAPGCYKETRNALDGWSSSSKFSPWLAAGCLSPRRILHRIRRYEAKRGANDSTYWLFFELLWREYFQWYAAAHGARLFRFSGIGEGAPETGFDRDIFAAWRSGETRWPLVNACMRELNATGYLSNRGRQIVASALVNELEQDWRAGAAYFEYQLVDYDVASNWGNWQYIAGVGADPRGGRHFDLEKQARQFDPNGAYLRRWLGAPRDRQETSGTVAGSAASGP